MWGNWTINWCSCCGYGTCYCRKTCPTCGGWGTVPAWPYWRPFRPYFPPMLHAGNAARDSALARG